MCRAATHGSAACAASGPAPQATATALASVGVVPGSPYVAVHLRLGGQEGERWALGRLAAPPEQLLAAAVRCGARARTRARGDGGGGGEGQWPHVLVTDNAELRARVAAGRLFPWRSPQLRPVHFKLALPEGSGAAGGSQGDGGGSTGAVEGGAPAGGLQVCRHGTESADFHARLRRR
jgi:hypothetical protein